MFQYNNPHPAGKNVGDCLDTWDCSEKCVYTAYRLPDEQEAVPKGR